MSFNIKSFIRELNSPKEIGKDKVRNMKRKEDYVELLHLHELIKSYRKFIMENGYMSEDQLIARDVDTVIEVAKDMFDYEQISDEKWNDFGNDIYALMKKHDDYVNSNAYPFIYIEEEGEKANEE